MQQHAVTVGRKHAAGAPETMQPALHSSRSYLRPASWPDDGRFRRRRPERHRMLELHRLPLEHNPVQSIDGRIGVIHRREQCEAKSLRRKGRQAGRQVGRQAAESLGCAEGSCGAAWPAGRVRGGSRRLTLEPPFLPRATLA